MTYTKEEFKRMWDGNADGGGITYGDLADCAIAWGLCSTPKIKPMAEIKNLVLSSAGCETGYELPEDDEE